MIMCLDIILTFRKVKLYALVYGLFLNDLTFGLEDDNIAMYTLDKLLYISAYIGGFLP